MPSLSPFFSRPSLVYPTALLLRLALLLYGRWQDSHTPVKYTDIDYLVFTDAARFVAHSHSPYDRATYRYTPLLAWLLLPTTWSTAGLGNDVWFEFGKVVFALGDVVTGWMMVRISRRGGMEGERALRFASLWLLNPMVANISTRGSSEGLVAVGVVALLWAAVAGQGRLAAVLLGLGVHFKIYPVVYAASVWWWLGGGRGAGVKGFLTRARMELGVVAFGTFMGLNAVMFACYGMDFINHSYRYHFTRIDHRHNFSVYNTLLHLNSAQASGSGFKVESLTFVPQMVLSIGVIPFMLAKRDLASTMLAQTFAFVTFNKVCTSQYFLWYMVFLPFYLPNSSLLREPVKGISALVLWILGQAFWLQQGYELEFLGKSTFFPGLWLASIFLFGVNCWILGIIVQDIASNQPVPSTANGAIEKKTK